MAAPAHNTLISDVLSSTPAPTPVLIWPMCSIKVSVVCRRVPWSSHFVCRHSVQHGGWWHSLVPHCDRECANQWYQLVWRRVFFRREAAHTQGSRCHVVVDHRTGAEDGIMLERRCDCKAAVMEDGSRRGREWGRERERERQVRCQTAAVAAGQGLRAVTHTGTPCRSHNVGEGLSVQQLRGEERWMSVCVCGWVGVCSAPIRHFLYVRVGTRDVTIIKIRAATAGSTAVCQILMSDVHAVKEPTDK